MRCLHFMLARRHACFCVALQSLSTYANAAALDGYTLLTDTDAVTPPMPPPNWIPFGSGKVAVGYDCPFLADGDTTDIAACQASCIANSQCNEINAEASGSGSGLTACILRFCSDPFSPQLSPYPQAWSSYGLNRSATCECGVHVFAIVHPLRWMQATGHFFGLFWSADDIFQAWHKDPAVLATLCTASSGCQGFNSNGACLACSGRVLAYLIGDLHAHRLPLRCRALVRCCRLAEAEHHCHCGVPWHECVGQEGAASMSTSAGPTRGGRCWQLSGPHAAARAWRGPAGSFMMVAPSCAQPQRDGCMRLVVVV